MKVFYRRVIDYAPQMNIIHEYKSIDELNWSRHVMTLHQAMVMILDRSDLIKALLEQQYGKDIEIQELDARIVTYKENTCLTPTN